MSSRACSGWPGIMARQRFADTTLSESVKDAISTFGRRLLIGLLGREVNAAEQHGPCARRMSSWAKSCAPPIMLGGNIAMAI